MNIFPRAGKERWNNDLQNHINPSMEMGGRAYNVYRQPRRKDAHVDLPKGWGGAGVKWYFDPLLKGGRIKKCHPFDVVQY